MNENKAKEQEPPRAPEAGAEKEAKPADKAASASPAPNQSANPEQAVEPERGRGRRRPAKSIPAGIAYVRSTFNNTLVSITDARGNLIAWGSAGRSGFKGSRKCTAFSATMVAQDTARQAIAKGMHEVEVRVQGAGSGRESAVRAIQSSGISVSSIKDTTPIPHNGCRPRKRRRV